MKNTIVFLSLFFYSFTILNGQSAVDNLSLTWGKEHPIEGILQERKVIGADENGYYILQLKRPKKMSIKVDVVLENYAPDLNKKKSALMDLDQRKEQGYFVDALLLKDALLLISSTYDRKSGKVTLYGHQIDRTSLKQIADPVQLMEMGLKLGLMSKPFADSKFQTSPDKSKILFFYRDKDSFHYLALDPQLNVLVEKKANLPSGFGLLSCEITNEGDVILAGKNSNNSVQILFCPVSGEAFDTYTYDTKKQQIATMETTLIKGGDLLGAGFYTDPKGKHIIGTYHFRVDISTKQLKAAFFDDLDPTYQLEVTDGLVGIIPAKLVVGAKEDSWLLVEVYSVEIQTGNSVSGRSSNSRHTFGDIIIVKRAPDGQYQWTRNIPKKQVQSNSSSYCSYGGFPLDNQLCLLYNDDPENINMAKNGKPKTAKFNEKTVLVKTTFDVTGNAVSQTLRNGKPIAHLFSLTPISDHDFLITGGEDDELYIGKLTIEQ